MMSQSDNLLVKISSSEKYLNDFLDGNLYISSLKNLHKFKIIIRKLIFGRNNSNLQTRARKNQNPNART